MFKGWIDKLKKTAEDKLNEDKDPAAQKRKKKESAEKNFKRTAEAIKIAKKGLDTYKQVSDKVDDAAKGAAEKTIELADKAAPIAEKVDGAIGAAAGKVKDVIGISGAAENPPAPEKKNDASGQPVQEDKDKGPGVFARAKNAAGKMTGAVAGTLGGAFDAAKDAISGGAKAAGEKIDKLGENSAKKPSTGSGLLDMIAPVVPETEATMPKEQKKPEDTPAVKPPQP